MGSVRAILDPRLNDDPEFSSKKDRAIAGRTEDAYLGGEWKYAQAAYGRVARSWGPTQFSGLLLGDDAYTYDHLFARVGTERIHISTVIAKLENYILSPGVESSRYFSTHRLAFNRGRFEGGLSEAFLYTGVGRGLEFSLLNPLNVYGLSWKNERTDGNLSFGGDFAFKSARFGTYSTQVLLDDIQIDECDTVCNEPSSYGYTFSAEGIPLTGEQRLFASYTRVSNLAYHTPNISERYSIYLVGLGRGFSDYDEVRAGIDLAIIPCNSDPSIRISPAAGSGRLSRALSRATRFRDDSRVPSGKRLESRPHRNERSLGSRKGFSAHRRPRNQLEQEPVFRARSERQAVRGKTESDLGSAVDHPF